MNKRHTAPSDNGGDHQNWKFVNRRSQAIPIQLKDSKQQ